MAEFNPDAYLSEEPETFDPDSYLGESGAGQPPSEFDAVVSKYHSGELSDRHKSIVEELAKRGEVNLEKGFTERVSADIGKRFDNTNQMLARRAPSGELSTLGAAREIALELPATTALAAGQAAGAISDIASEGLKSTYKTLTPESVQEAISTTAKNILDTDIGQYGLKALQKGGEIWGHFKESYPDSAMALEGLGNVANVAGSAAALKGAGNVVSSASTGGKELLAATGDIARKISSPLPAEIEKRIGRVIADGFEKGIRPTIVGKKTFNAAAKASDKANEAVKEIVGMKDVLSFTTESGEKIYGQLPQSVSQFSEAIGQAKNKIYQEYSQMAKAAGEKGANFDTTPIIKKLASVADDLKHNPQVRKYAEGLIDDIVELKGQSPEVIEARIADLNRSLSGFYEGRVGQAKAQVDASVANLMREELDKNITSAMGSGYQAFKNKYGSLASIEKEVQNRATVFSRQNKKGLADFSDIFTGAEIIGGAASVLSGNPGGIKSILSGLGGKFIKSRIKSSNNADNIVKNMFNDVDKALSAGDMKSQLFKNIDKLKETKKFDPANPFNFPPGGVPPTKGTP